LLASTAEEKRRSRAECTTAGFPSTNLITPVQLIAPGHIAPSAPISLAKPLYRFAVSGRAGRGIPGVIYTTAVSHQLATADAVAFNK
jgi:hypothetical protein